MHGRTYDIAPGDRMTFLVSNPEIDFIENEVGYLAVPRSTSIPIKPKFTI